MLLCILTAVLMHNWHPDTMCEYWWIALQLFLCCRFIYKLLSQTELITVQAWQPEFDP